MGEHMDQREAIHEVRKASAAYPVWDEKAYGATEVKVSVNHPDMIRDEVAEALRWALSAARASSDYQSVAAIALELNGLR